MNTTNEIKDAVLENVTGGKLPRPDVEPQVFPIDYEKRETLTDETLAEVSGGEVMFLPDVLDLIDGNPMEKKN